MALPTVYNTGTISVENGSTTVTGTGTAFKSAGIKAGDKVGKQAAGFAGIRLAADADDENEITLAVPWPHATLTNSAYEIEIVPESASLATSVRQLLQSLTSGTLYAINEALTEAANGSLVQKVGGVVAAISVATLFAQVPDGTISAPGLAFGSDTNTGIWRSASDQIDVVTGGASAIRVKSNQHVLIGTTTDSALLTVGGTMVVTGTLTGAAANFSGAVTAATGTTINGTTSAYFRVAKSSGTANYLQMNAGAGTTSLEVGDITTPSDFKLIVGNAAVLTATSGGNIGIGRTPSARLHVIGPSETALIAYFGNDISQTLSINSTSTGMVFNNNNSGYIAFEVGGTHAFRVGSDRSFLVGTTANGGWTGTFKMAVVSSGPGFSTYSTSTAGDSAAYFRVDATSERFISCNYNGTQVGSITTNGSIITVNGTSDARHKKVRRTQRNIGLHIRALDVVEYDWRTGDKGFGFGLIAQQAYGVLPSDLRDFVVNKPANDDDAWTVNQAAPGVLALWAVKDIYGLYDAQEQRIAALEAEIKTLKKAA